MTGAPLTISDLAARTGLRPDTVRYYERVGLMPAPRRTSGDHRRYHGLAVDRLQFIHGAQRLGLRLHDVRDLLAVRHTGECPCEPAEPLLRSRIVEIDAELDRLQRLRADLVAMADQLPSPTCPDPVPGTWCPPTTTPVSGPPSGACMADASVRLSGRLVSRGGRAVLRAIAGRGQRA